ncbi:hypothetical protein BKI52_36100 [marine bacterium AO1-C]|nr:hypothetical protein BKI52_36100 [marine bacterium AO1-C]
MKKILGIVAGVCLGLITQAQNLDDLTDCNEEKFIGKNSETYTPPPYTPKRDAWKKWRRGRNYRLTHTLQKDRLASAGTTIITAEDIALAPARNLLDLLELYVPGAYWINSEEGKLIGMRGWMAPRNLRYQVFVDGVNVNQQSHSGAINELENWDMDDIAQIEVIRGAAAARYGAGAVSGVILITTKVAVAGKKTQVGGNYVSGYNNYGGNFTHTVANDDLTFTFFGSWQRTLGATVNTFATNPRGLFNPEIGYIGQSFPFFSDFSRPSFTLLGDYDGEPQMKLAAELNILNKWKVKARYTSAGTVLNGVGMQSLQQVGLVIDSVTTDVNGFPVYNYSREFTGFVNLKAFRTRQMMASLSREWHHLDSTTNRGYFIKALASWNTQDFQSRSDSTYTYGVDVPEFLRSRFGNLDDPLYKRYNFGETTLNAQVTGTYILPIGQIALGADYTRKNITTGWNDLPTEIRLGDGGVLIHSENSTIFGLPSQYGGISDNLYAFGFVGNGWVSDRWDFFGELNLSPVKWFNLTASTRVTTHSFSKPAWNHRLSLSFPINHAHLLQFNGQIANRLATEEQLHEIFSYNRLAPPEKSMSYEARYLFTPNDQWRFGVTVYQNRSEISNLNRPLAENFITVGQMQYSGIEAEVSFKTRQLLVRANYTHLVPGLVDYYNRNYQDSLQVESMFFKNTPNEMAKLLFRYRFFNQRAAIQANVRAMWNYEFARDDTDIIIKGLFDVWEFLATSADELQDIRNFRNTFEEQNPYSLDARLDISASLKISDNITVSAYVLNLLATNKARRYTFDDGLQANELRAADANLGVNVLTDFFYSYQRLQFIEEPTVFGARVKLTF